jgi:hypothetical protein
MYTIGSKFSLQWIEPIIKGIKLGSIIRHAAICNMHSMLIMKFGCIHAHNFFLAMYKRNNVSFKISLCHRLDRVPGFLSSRLNWLPPPSHPQASFVPFLWWGGRHTRSGRGGGGNQFRRRDRHSGTLGIV